MPLRVKQRKDRPGAYQITGTVAGQRVRETAKSRKLTLAREEAAALEARLLREQFHGKRRGARLYAEIAEAYLGHEPRHPGQVKRVLATVRGLGDVSGDDIDQEAIDRLRDKILRPSPSPATVRATIITPVRAVLNFGWRRKWCDKPSFELPRLGPSRTESAGEKIPH
jgi:hypothetical protein